MPRASGCRLPSGTGSHDDVEPFPAKESFGQALASLEAAHDREVAALQAQLRRLKAATPKTVSFPAKGRSSSFANEVRQRSGAVSGEANAVEAAEGFLPKDKAKVKGPAVSEGVAAKPLMSDGEEVVERASSDCSMETEVLGEKSVAGVESNDIQSQNYVEWLVSVECQDLPAKQRWTVLAGKLELQQANGGHMVSGRLMRTCNWEILPVWMVCRSAAQEAYVKALQRGGNISPNLMTNATVLRTGDTNTDETFLQPFVMHPNSWALLFWRLLGALCILMDCMLIPLGSFDLQDLETSFAVLTTGSSVFWLMDFFSCFLIGEEIDGVVELRPSAVAKRYMGTWFLPDVAILTMDGALLLIEVRAANKDQYGEMRFAKFLRLVRLVRLVRIIKLQQVKNNVLYRLNSGALILAFKITGMVLGILALNHYVACMWYAVGLFNESDQRTWIVQFDLNNAGFKFQYLAALHWALTQFSPATNNIAPQNLAERFFAIAVVLFAMIVFSSFISSVTNAVNQLRAINMERIRDESRIHDFISSRKINSQLSIKIHRFVKENYKKCRTRVKESDIPLFAEIPESMRIQLHEQMYMSYLEYNPMLSPFICIDRPLAVKVCHTAFKEGSYLPRQDVFVNGFEAKTVYVVIAGHLEYTSVYYDHLPQPVQSGAWVSEMALWVNWEHRGQFTACGTSELALMDCDTFQVLCRAHGGPMLLCLRKLALFLASHCECEEMKYHRTVNHANCMRPEPITDLSMDKVVLEDLADRARRLWLMRADIADLMTDRSNSRPFRHTLSNK